MSNPHLPRRRLHPTANEEVADAEESRARSSPGSTALCRVAFDKEIERRLKHTSLTRVTLCCARLWCLRVGVYVRVHVDYPRESGPPRGA